MRKGCDRLYQFGLTSTLALLGWVVGENALAQITPDETLGNERSVVRQGVQVRGGLGDRIEGGAQRGANLFHSFQEFNIGDGQRVYFGNPDNVANILSRVIGGNPSNILGTLGVDGAANLFFLNPNGILFGPNASLDVNGSFVATTADAIGFGEQGFFSATNPEVPSQLLTVNPSAFFFNQAPTGNITVQSRTPIFPALSINGLFVPLGENLTLLGGDINVEGGGLNALSGRVDIGSVNGAGIIGLNADGSLNFPESIERADISFTNRARANAFLDTGGDIAITARNISLLEGSELRTGILQGLGSPDSQAGNITLNATGRIQLGQSSRVSNIVYSGSTGNSGNIDVIANSLLIDGLGSRLTANVFGQGNSGSVTINVRGDIFIEGGEIFSRVSEGGSGNAGGIQISSDSLTLNDNALVIVTNRGGGNAGNIQIDTGYLSVNGGSQLTASAFGNGNSGNILINAHGRVSFDGIRTDENGKVFESAAFTNLEAEGNGQAGNIIITADSVSFTNGASLFADLRGEGRGGNIQISGRTLSVESGSQLRANTLGQGDAGNIIIDVEEAVSFSGGDAFSDVTRNATGRGGNIWITANSLSVSNSGQLQASTQGQGNAGNIIISVRDTVSFDGTGTGGNSFGTAASSTVAQEAQGQGGNIEIDADSIFITNGAQLVASTLGQGNAGDVIISATDLVTISGTSADGRTSSGVFTATDVTAVGNGGNINIAAGILEVFDGARLLTAISGLGDAGNVRIDADERVTFRDSAISTASQPNARGQAGNIDIATNLLELTNGSQLITSTSGLGNAGNVRIDADERVTFRDSAISTTSQQGSIGEAGGIVITTNGVLELVNGSQFITSTFSAGNSGDIIINAADRVLLDGVGSDGLSSGLFSNTTPNSTGRGGIVSVTVPNLHITNGAVINARTENDRPGGNIVIEADRFTALNGGQVITTTLDDGRAGNIILNVDRIRISGSDSTFAQRQSEFPEQTTNERNGESGLFASTRTSSNGNGGRITLNSNNLTLENGARISAQSQGTGTAGNIRLNVSEQLQLTDSDIVTNAPRSSGGDITVNDSNSTGLIILRGDSDITTNSQGNGGNITLQGSGIIAFDDSDILARSDDARGGNITLAPFFGASTSFESEPPFDGNDRVDINADGSVAAGTITTPDTSFIQNSLTDLPESAIDPDNLVANSCVVRSQEQGGTFVITGAEGLPQRPGDATFPTYPTGEVRSIPDNVESDDEQSWKMGDPIVEPQGVYQLPDGQLVLSRECPEEER